MSGGQIQVSVQDNSLLPTSLQCQQVSLLSSIIKLIQHRAWGIQQLGIVKVSRGVSRRLCWRSNRSQPRNEAGPDYQPARNPFIDRRPSDCIRLRFPFWLIIIGSFVVESQCYISEEMIHKYFRAF